jgi:hypothetical protein
MATVWPATHDVFDKLQEVKDKYHSNLGEISVVVEFSDAKPFKVNRLNLGNVRKFSCANKIWQKGDFDFCITIVGEVWQDILQGDEQHNAILDLHLTRIEPVCVPQIIVENKKRHAVKDEFGRIVFTEEQKLDKNGNPMWRIVPIDLGVLSQNIRRFGYWFEDLVEFRDNLLILSHSDSKVEMQ